MTTPPTPLEKLNARLSPPPLFDHPALLNAAPIRLKPVDLAALLGVSRARISQLTKSGRIQPFPDGTFDPNAVVASLIRVESPKRARSKVLSIVRAEVEDARRQATEAQAAHAELLDRYQLLLDGFRTLASRWLRTEFWLNRFAAGLESRTGDGPIDAAVIDDAFESAGAAAEAADHRELLSGLADEDRTLLELAGWQATPAPAADPPDPLAGLSDEDRALMARAFAPIFDGTFSQFTGKTR